MAKKTLTADFSATGGETSITLEVTQAKLDLNIDADYFEAYALYLSGSLAKKITKVTVKSRDDETKLRVLMPLTDAGVDMADLNEQWSLKAGGHEPIRLKVSHGMQIVLNLAAAAAASETVVAMCTVDNPGAPADAIGRFKKLARGVEIINLPYEREFGDSAGGPRPGSGGE